MFNITSIKESIAKEIFNTALVYLESAPFNKNLLAKYSIKPLAYSKEQSKRKISNDRPNPQTAASDFSYIPNQLYPCVEFQFGFIGDDNNLQKLFNQDFLNKHKLSTYYNSRTWLIYKVFAETQIEGDDDIIFKINEKAIAIRKAIEDRIALFNEEAEKANQQLKTYIEEIVPVEITKKKVAEDSLNKLNPF